VLLSWRTMSDRCDQKLAAELAVAGSTAAAAASSTKPAVSTPITGVSGTGRVRQAGAPLREPQLAIEPRWKRLETPQQAGAKVRSLLASGIMIMGPRLDSQRI
jgi:hypothetical protein